MKSGRLDAGTALKVTILRSIRIERVGSTTVLARTTGPVAPDLVDSNAPLQRCPFGIEGGEASSCRAMWE